MRSLTVVSATLFMTALTYADSTVTFDVSSPCAGATVKAGDTIEWTITVSVTTGDNYGLALAAVDLVQDPANPEFFDMPPGAAPPDMQDFDDPNGIANPDPGSQGWGYGGTPIGIAGEKNLLQIGGAQNTFGVPGDVAGLDYNVRPLVGQSGAQVLATGSFEAPATHGDYTFSLENAFANTLAGISSPPNVSPVGVATAILGDASFSFWVATLGDIDHDGDVDLADLATMLGTYGRCWGDPEYIPAAEFNCNGCIDLTDLAALLANYGS